MLRMAPSAFHLWAHFPSTLFQMTVRFNIWLSLWFQLLGGTIINYKTSCKQQKSISHNYEAWKSKIRVMASVGFGEEYLICHISEVSCILLWPKEEREDFVRVFLRGNPTHKASPLWFKTYVPMLVSQYWNNAKSWNFRYEVWMCMNIHCITLWPQKFISSLIPP